MSLMVWERACGVETQSFYSVLIPLFGSATVVTFVKVQLVKESHSIHIYSSMLLLGVQACGCVLLVCGVLHCTLVR